MPKMGGLVGAVAALLAVGGVASVWVAPAGTGAEVALFLLVCVALGALVLVATTRAADVEREVVARTRNLLAEVEARRAVEARLLDAQRLARLNYWEWHPTRDELDLPEPLVGTQALHGSGRPLADLLNLVDARDRASLRAAHDAAPHAAGPTRCEFRSATAESRWLAAALRFERGVVRVTSLDVTEHKLAELAASEGRARLSVALSSARMGTWEFFVAERRFVFDEREEGLFGFAPGEFDGTPEMLRSRIHPDDLDGLRESLYEAVERKTTYQRDFRVIHPGESAPRWLQGYGRPLAEPGGQTRVIGVNFDVTERKLAEFALRASESRRAEAQRAARLGSWDYDPARHELDPGPAAATLLGLAERPLPIGEFLSRIPPEDRPAVEAALAAAARNAPRAEVEHRYAHPDGPRHLILRVLGGEAGPVHASSQDITEQKLAAEERGRIETLLQRTQKLESLGVLAGGVAHDFNNLLTGILGHASLARELLPTDSPLHSYLKPIEKAAEHAAQLCLQMLTYAGKSDTVRGPLDLNRVVEESWELLRMALPKGAQLESLPAPGPLRLIGDAGQLCQAVLNLVQNAADALPTQGGAVTVATGTRPGGQVYLEVRDTGGGMAPEVAARVFEPFFTTKFAGRGLGLSAVHGIVRTHGGEIELESAPGEGATVRLVLPAAEVAQTPGPGAGVTRVEELPLALLADDEVLIRRLAAIALTSLGYRVAEADGGAVALDLFHRDPRRFAVALIDLTMPGVSGRDVLAAVRAARPDLPVVVMSGCSPEQAGDLAFDERVVFLPKPFRASELTACLRAATCETVAVG